MAHLVAPFAPYTDFGWLKVTLQTAARTVRQFINTIILFKILKKIPARFVVRRAGAKNYYFLTEILIDFVAPL